MSYPINLVPADGESLIGAAHRLAADNGLHHFRNLMDDIGRSGQGAEFSPDSISALEEKAGLAPGLLVGRQFVRTSESVAVLGEVEFQADLLHHRNTRLCVECLREGRPHLLNWQCKAITHCLIHRCPLISECPDCGVGLLWSRRNMMHCRAGHSLTDNVTSTPASFDFSGMSLIDDRLRILQALPAQRPDLANGIPALNAADMITFLTFLGQLALFDSQKCARPRPAYIPDQPDYLTAGLSLARDWPRHFEKHVTRIALPKSQELLEERMRSWLVFRCEPASIGPAERVVQEELQRIALKLGRRPVAGRANRETGPIPHGYVRRRDIELQRLLTRGEIDGMLKSLGLDPGRMKPAFLPEHLVNDLVHDPARPRVPFGKAAHKLRVSGAVLRELIASGLFGEMAAWRQQFIPWSFLYNEEIETFHTALRNRVAESSPKDGIMTLHKIQRQPDMDSTIASLVRAIYFGDIALFSFATSIGSLTVRTKDVNRLRARQANARATTDIKRAASQ